MNDENIFKMSKMANKEIGDVPTLNILICYLLKKIGKPVETEQLYEISVGTEIINYFSYHESIDYLLKNELIKSEHSDEDNKDYYVLLRKGELCAERLRDYVSKSDRDKLVLAALKYFARLKNEQEIKIDYIPIENGGYYTQIRCLDNNADLMNLRLFAPDLTQAKFIGEKVMLNPATFYGKVIELVLSNEEDPYDLSDN